MSMSYLLGGENWLKKKVLNKCACSGIRDEVEELFT